MASAPILPAITIRQPWAQAIVTGEKQVETRGWRVNYRGPVAIHAASRPGIDGLPTGAIVAIARIVDCKRVEDLRPGARERALGDFTPGRFGWVLADVTALPAPIKVSGLQGLWRVERKLGAEMATRLARTLAR